MIRPSRLLNYFLVTVMVIFYSAITQANWHLKKKDSVIHFTSVKNNSVTEIHSFKNVNGKIDNKGNAKLTIELDSINTMIQIRDERMRSLLLETDLYPKATLTAQVDINTIKKLATGTTITQPLNFELDLHGKKNIITSQVLVVALANNRLLVNTLKPVIVNLAEFDLVKGVNTLREIAKLSSISTSVLVSAQLVFYYTQPATL